MTGYVDDDGFISEQEYNRRMSMIRGGFTPVDDDAPVLVSRELFEEMLEAVAKRDGKELEPKYSGTYRGTLTYVEATVYEMEPHPDPLNVAADQG